MEIKLENDDRDVGHPLLTDIGALVGVMLMPDQSSTGEYLPLEADNKLALSTRRVRWQARFLLTGDKQRERILSAIDRVDRLPSDLKSSSTDRLRKILLADLESLADGPSFTRGSKARQRLTAFLVTEVQRAMGYSLDQAILGTSELSAQTPEFDFVSEATLRSWYNKSGPRYRGLKKFACWSVAYWRRLAFNVLKVVQREIVPGVEVAEAATAAGILTRAELASIRDIAIEFNASLRRVVDALQSTRSPNVKNGWKNVNIKEVSRNVLPMLEGP